MKGDAAAHGVVLATGFMLSMGLSIVVPVLPHYARIFGASPFEVTLVFAASAGASAVAQPFWGRISDRYGRKIVIVISLAAAAAAFVWIGLASTLWELYAARAVAGFFGGMIPALFAVLADVTNDEQRTAAFGRLTAMFAAGFILGPVIGGVLTEGLTPEPNFGLPFFVAAAVLLGLALAAATALGETRPVKSGGARGEGGRGFRERARLYLSARLGVPMLAGVAVQFGSASTSAIFALWTLEKFGWGVSETAWALTYMSVLVTFMSGVAAGRLSAWFGPERTLTAALLGVVVAFIALAALGSVLEFYVVLVVAAFGNGVGRTVANSLVSINADPSYRGEALGLANGLGAASAAGGPLLAGWMFGAVGIGAPFLIVAAAAGFAMILSFMSSGGRLARDAS